jgi:hypothetical protein
MIEALLKGMGSKLSVGGQVGSQSTNSSGTTKSKLNIDQAGLDKIVQDILGSEQGLAQLVQGQNTAGLYGSSTNTLMAQQFVTDIAGELAKLTAETVQTNEAQSKTKSKSIGAKTVICTELERQGLLNTELYQAGHSHFLSLSPQTVRGYRVWANKVVPLMGRSKLLCKLLLPLAEARYLQITGRKKSILGWLMSSVAEPICYMIGFFVPAGDQYGYKTAIN